MVCIKGGELNSFIRLGNSYWMFLIIISNLLPECKIFFFLDFFKPSFPLALTVDGDLHCPDIWAGDIVGGDAFIWSRLLFGDGFQLHVLSFCHKFVSACREKTEQCGIRDKPFRVSFASIAWFCMMHVGSAIGCIVFLKFLILHLLSWWTPKIYMFLKDLTDVKNGKSKAKHHFSKSLEIGHY